VIDSFTPRRAIRTARQVSKFFRRIDKGFHQDTGVPTVVGKRLHELPANAARDKTRRSSFRVELETVFSEKDIPVLEAKVAQNAAAMRLRLGAAEELFKPKKCK